MRRALVIVLSAAAAACGPHSVGAKVETTPKERKYKEGKYETGLEPVGSGSLWPENGRGLFADFRAFRVGDLVTVRLDEDSKANGDANTQLDRKASEAMGVPNFFGLTAALAKAYPDINPEKLVEWMAESGFTGNGTTSRANKLDGSISVRVKRVLPNGDLFVEGTKVILINDEEVHMYLSGVIRAEDIDSTNAVASNTIADAQIEFSGRGALDQNQRQGWFTRLWAKLRPF
jgi:flagellar L-ring protein precursor FlgH